MRLLLDEHLSVAIARELRSRGHDVLAVAERNQLRSESDRALFAAAPEQRRAIVTHDLADYRTLVRYAMRSGRPTFGLVCLGDRFRYRLSEIGLIVEALDALLGEHPEDDAAIRAGGEIWLQVPNRD